MSWTAAEEARIADIEEALIELQTAITNLAAKQQVRQLSLLKQSEIEALETQVTALEATVQELEGRL